MVDRENLQIEDQEWLDSLESVLKSGGPERVRHLLELLSHQAALSGVALPSLLSTPYINTIPLNQQPAYPGDGALEWRIRSLIRWNAMAMVVRANRSVDGIGGHISTFASAATLYDVAFNHFFRGKGEGEEGDQIYFQGHAAPGVYSRAYLEGRITEKQLENFRRELKPEGGLSSYPHPWWMPDFWEFPTVSMGLSPLMAIYQARFNRYLENRGLKKANGSKVWAFLGDGEMDEPESLAGLSLAGREKLDNLIFVINCNLQRLDGPVRGNGKIIQELEGLFRGAGWNVIKVIWGSDWDPLLAQDKDGVLVRRMGEVCDGQYQKYTVSSGAYIRENFFGTDPRLQEIVRHLSDDQLRKLSRGGHDPEKMYAAYKAAVEHRGSPTVILAKTIKGYGLGEAGEGKNVTHQQKKLNEDELREFRTRFGIPISDEAVAHAPFYRPPEDSPEIRYLKERRQKLGGVVPSRVVRSPEMKVKPETFDEFYEGTKGRHVSTTMVFVRLLSKLLRDQEVGKFIVPIVPDEARTFGMESLFRPLGIYSSVGQLYPPVDSESLLYYREAKDGQILEEGITEAGSMASFIAAGSAYATHGINMVPFFIFYSMFGLQRVGDLVWAAADTRCRGFLMGATAGRTTLQGEGLQHQDGQSHLLTFPVPNLYCYDPAFAYELAVIIQEGFRRMYEKQESIFYYITLQNENYEMPSMPDGVREGILKGMYLYQKSAPAPLKAHLLGSGSILNEVIKAAQILREKFGVSADVWSVTGYKELYRDGMEVERWNRLHPGEGPKIPYVARCFEGAQGVFVAASDYVRALPDCISRWLPKPFVSLGADGFGRSESRESLRDFFEVDHRHVVLAALGALADEGLVQRETVRKAISEMKIDPEKAHPFFSK
ncbi:MAG: pyruvate dehydrogenase (acetyl-transferring), homodimeric type [bacterium]